MNSYVTDIEITLHTMYDVVMRLIILRVLALVKGFITSTGFLLLERQLSWVITFVTEEIYLFDTIIPQLDHMQLLYGLMAQIDFLSLVVSLDSFISMLGFNVFSQTSCLVLICFLSFPFSANCLSH